MRRFLPTLSDDDWDLIGLTLLIKVGLLVFGVIAFVVVNDEKLTDPHRILDIWNHWDAPHYLDLARYGYNADGPGDVPLFIVFYPLYPWLTGAVNAVLRDPVVSGFFVTTIASLFVAPLLARLVGREFGASVGRNAAWFLLIFPTAFVLHIPYTEAVFMAVLLGSFLAVRNGHWWLAGILGALATLARVNGLILIPALAAEAFTEWLTDPEHRLRPGWAWIAVVPVGFLVYLGVNQAVYGDALHFLFVQEDHWYKSLAAPWVGIGGVIDSILHRQGWESMMLGWMELAFIILGLAGTIYAAFRFRPSWFAWMAGNWLLFVSTSFVMSVPRYALTLFPLFAWFALAGRSSRVWLAITFTSIILLGFFASRMAVGAWAF
jgi:hypothetical protein